MKTTVIFHSADFDGLFCREIAKKFLPDATFIGWDYRDPKIPFPSEGTVYVLDLSPECFESVPKYQERMIWIDHHKTSIDSHPNHIPGYRIDGVAACRLAWQWFAMLAGKHDSDIRANIAGVDVVNFSLPSKQDFIDRKVFEPLAVRLAGEYDIWDKRDPRAELFQHGLRSRDLTGWWDYMLKSGGDRIQCSIDELERMIAEGKNPELMPDGTVKVGDFAERIVENLLKRGEAIQYASQRADAGTMGRSFLVKFEGLNFLALNTARCNSLTFAAKDIPETGHDALMGFYFDGKKWNVSLYHARHNMGIDLSEIAKRNGGGGHRGACGFQARNMPFTVAFDFDK